MERDPAPGSGDGHLDVAFAETKLTALVETWESSVEKLGCAVPAAQLRVLLVIDREGRLNLGRLASSLGASPSATRKLCDRMTVAGLPTREPARPAAVRQSCTPPNPGTGWLPGYEPGAATCCAVPFSR